MFQVDGRTYRAPEHTGYSSSNRRGMASTFCSAFQGTNSCALLSLSNRADVFGRVTFYNNYDLETSKQDQNQNKDQGKQLQKATYKLIHLS